MLRIGVSSAFALELPGLHARMLLLGLHDPSEVQVEDGEGEYDVLRARLVVESGTGREVFEITEGEVVELLPGRWFVLSGVNAPLVLLDEVPSPRSRR